MFEIRFLKKVLIRIVMDFSWWSKLRYEVKNSSPLLLSYGVIQGGIYKHPATPPLAERSHENKRRLQINVTVASSKGAKKCIMYAAM